MFGIGSLSRSMDNAAKALELQSQRLVVESAKDVAKSITDAKLDAKQLAELQKLDAVLNKL